MAHTIKYKKRKAAERQMAKKGLMNNQDGEYRPISNFNKDGMRDGYCAGYRIQGF